MVIGGAGNVARNITSLGAKCLFVGVVGEDDPAAAVEALAEEPLIEPYLVVDRASEHAQDPFRVGASFDASAARRLGDVQPVNAASRAGADRPRRGDAACWGGRPVRLCQGRADAARHPRRIDAAKPGKPVVVDPKGSDYSIYRGATLITPTARNSRRPRCTVASEAEIAAAAADLGRLVDAHAVLVTRSEDGMTLLVRRRRRACAGLSGEGARRLGRRRYGCRGMGTCWP